MEIYKKHFDNIVDYQTWHEEQYQANNGIKECGLSINNNQVDVQYINIRG